MKNSSKKSIIKEARKLFSEFGFLGVSMEDIASSLGVTKAALYYHFQGKKDLYLKVLENSFFDLKKALASKMRQGRDAKKELLQLIQSYLEFGIKEKILIKSQDLKVKNMDPEIREYILELRSKIKELFCSPLKEILKGKKGKKGTVGLSFLTSFLLGTMDRLILEASFFRKGLNARKRAQQILKMIH